MGGARGASVKSKDRIQAKQLCAKGQTQKRWSTDQRKMTEAKRRHTVPKIAKVFSRVHYTFHARSVLLQSSDIKKREDLIDYSLTGRTKGQTILQT